MNSDTTAPPDYLKTLSRFPLYLRQGWQHLDERRGFFGDGSHVESGIRINANVAFCAALLASDPEYAGAQAEDGPETMLAYARKAIAYLTQAHTTGGGTCADGLPWGGGWQSAWWSTRLALGARMIWPRLDPGERESVERLVVHEADHLVPLIIPTGLEEDTKAEENAWDAEILATAVALLPDHPNREAWWTKLSEYGFNIFSVARDRESPEIVQGRPLRDWVHTVNLHSDYTLENHGSYHFCYVASPLHSLAWAHYALQSGGVTPPPALQHHVQDVWQAAKRTFLDHRFAYVGGQDWARYTYGEYFIVPALVWLQHLLKDADASAMERARHATLQGEQQENENGSFFGRRFTGRSYSGQAAKYETDCYANMGLAYLWRRLGAGAVVPSNRHQMGQHLAGTLVSPECGIAFGRTDRVFASFSWKTLTTPEPLALFVPLGRDDLAEWSPNNLFGRIVTLHPERKGVWIRRMRETALGFEVEGIVIYRDRKGRTLYTHELGYKVDLQSASAEVASRFVAQQPLFVRRVEGLSLAVPSDRFNGFSRTIHHSEGEMELVFDPGRPLPWGSTPNLRSRIVRKWMRETLRDGALHRVPGRWLNIDGVLGVVPLGMREDAFYIHQPAGRNLDNASLHVDRVMFPLRRPNRRFAAGEEILKSRFRLVCGDVAATQAAAAGNTR